MPVMLRHAFNIAYGALAFFVILTLKFTRRRKGFRVTPMDFLVLFVAVVMPYFPNAYLQSAQMGIVATRIVVVIFSYEVLIGELRGLLRGQAFVAAGALIFVALRGMLG